MNVKRLTKGLAYKGEAVGKRQTYYIFQGNDFYLNLSFKRSDPNAGNFHVVEPETVAYVRKRFDGKTGVTDKEVFEAAHRTRHLATRLEALNILYVMVGLGQAKVDKRHKEKSLYFNIR